MTENQPLISIVMPCFNSAGTVGESIQSVLAQTHTNFELIVIDNGSSDDSVALIRSFIDTRLRLLVENRKGVSSARNLGISSATGDFIAFLDSDDTWEAQFLEMMCHELRLHPRAVLAYCGWQNIGLPGARGAPFVPPDYEQPDKLNKLFASCRWPIHAALTRRDAILGAGCFNASYTHAEDFALWLRVCLQGPIARVPKVLAYYHHHDQGQASSQRGKAALAHYEAQLGFLAEHAEISTSLGQDAITALTLGHLYRGGLECYWQGNLAAAQVIFRKILSVGYGDWRSWKIMLPSLLPLPLYGRLIAVKDRLGSSK